MFSRFGTNKEVMLVVYHFRLSTISVANLGEGPRKGFIFKQN